MSTRKSRLPEPVQPAKRSKSRDKSEGKSKEKRKDKENKEERTKSKDKEKRSSKEKDTRKEEKKKEKSSKDSKSKPKPKTPTPPPPEPEPEPEEEEEVYADDFEDYEDDFEDDDEQDDLPPPIVKRPLPSPPQLREDTDSEESARSPPDSAKENRRRSSIQTVKAPPVDDSYVEVEEEEIEKVKEEDATPMMRRLQSRQGGRRPEPPKQLLQQNARVLSATERKISFTNAPAVSAVAVSESNDRYRILRNLIGGLERHTTVLIAQPPVKDYDFYIEMFGNSGKSQTFTQTGEDNINEECQTEQEEMVTKWTQQPAQDDIGWGAEGGSGSLKYGGDDPDLDIFRGQSAAQTESLHRFMDISAGVMLDLLSSTRHAGDYYSMQNKSRLSFSAGFNQFQLVPTASESKITCLVRSRTDEYSLLCAFHVLQSNHPSIVKRSLLVEYPLDTNAPPQRLYLAQSVVNTMSYSDDGTMLFAGLQDGSIVAWDLYESSSLFDFRLPWLDSKEGIPLREPSFDTSFMSSIINESRSMAIVSLHVVSSSGSIFQLCALDECGSISTWTVERSPKAESGIQGGRPGSRLLLTLSSIVRPDASVLKQSPSGYIMANCMAALPEEQMQLLIGTDVGFIASVSRGKTGGYHGPRLYKSPMHVFGEVLSMRFSPFEPKILATGLSTGSISIHRGGQVAPLVILTPPNSSRTPVTTIEWSPICPTVFYTMHESGHLLTWNLSIGKAPQAVNDLGTDRMGRVVCSYVWHEKAWAKEVVGIAYMALGLIGGVVHVHALEPVKSATNQSLTGILRRMEAGL